MSREPPLPALVFWAVLGLAPLVAPGWLLAQLAQHLGYGLLALSLAWVWGQAGLLSFCQALFFGSGAYLFALLALGRIPGLPDSPWLGLLCAPLFSALLAFLLGLALLSARIGSGAAWAVMTLVLGVIAERVAVTSPWLGGSNGLVGVPPLAVPWPSGTFELVDPLPLYLLLFAATALVHLALARHIASPAGALVRAVRDDALRAAHLGIDPLRLRLFVFTGAAAIAGLGGGLFAAQFGFVAPPLLGLGLSTEALVWVAVGGRGSPLAALVGTLVVKGVEELLGRWLEAWWPLAMGLVVVAVVLAFPAGLVGGLLARRGRPVPADVAGGARRAAVRTSS
ncbi:MAG: branched-chain amino acid ABC transporter permease [Geminicoccaceae bacterium]|nr:branched-chain amino acid ABC transporter permease [Geminicoccaceae bacterium]MCS7268369.1 branched-chain amino acid ABC transporter permease [Geminicoccaceae bacterium]MCX7629432.1 branched-chain amino acid ABC transporter permease [Geminicoccaceae bacterium]MDW8124262.1 branched-chain amino acid ABC transporter permease [Geminicoccaceae bacterium]MDW8341129.1 branched-chain amino acid ABC transporter permease [Geminicoccaceae bacterium]